MAVVNLPVGAVFTRRAWTPPAQNQVNKSAWTRARRVLRSPGVGLWRGSFAVMPFSNESESWPWKAFLAVLEGQANTFLMPFSRCRQTAAANPTVRVAAGGGAETLQLEGLTPNARYLYGGQGLSVTGPSGQRQLLLLTQDIVADGAGQAVARFRAALREVQGVGAVVEGQRPVCEMAMLDDNSGWDEDQGVYTIAFDAEESYAA